MKDKKVMLSIRGMVENDQNDIVELTTEGRSYREDQTHCISYDETEMSGMDGTTTTVKVENARVSVIRLGAVNSLMEFEEGKHNVTLYSTPFGDIPMDIVTKKIAIDYDEAEEPVEVKVNYDIEIGGKTNSQKQINIRVRKC